MQSAMPADISVRDLGRMPYREALELQQRLQSELKEAKLSGTGGEETVLLVEHPHVYTLGRHGKPENMLLSPERLSALGAELVSVGRGGDITYHGPGQLVVYPILDLERHGLGIKAYVDLLEESVIRTIAAFGIKGERVEGATGVWLDKGKPGERKICAIGVACSRYVTMHGLALNVNTDLKMFSAINPCGFIDKGVASIAGELGREVNLAQVKALWSETFLSLLKSSKDRKLPGA